MSNDDDDNIDNMAQTLMWIGFNKVTSRESFKIDVEQFDGVWELTDIDISDLEYSYSKRTVADGRLIFGLQNTKRLKSMIQWVQDFARVSKTPNINNLDEASFRAALGVEAQRSIIRKQ